MQNSWSKNKWFYKKSVITNLLRVFLDAVYKKYYSSRTSKWTSSDRKSCWRLNQVRVCSLSRYLGSIHVRATYISVKFYIIFPWGYLKFCNAADSKESQKLHPLFSRILFQLEWICKISQRSWQLQHSALIYCWARANLDCLVTKIAKDASARWKQWPNDTPRNRKNTSKANFVIQLDPQNCHRFTSWMPRLYQIG